MTGCIHNRSECEHAECREFEQLQKQLDVLKKSLDEIWEEYIYRTRKNTNRYIYATERNALEFGFLAGGLGRRLPR